MVTKLFHQRMTAEMAYAESLDQMGRLESALTGLQESATSDQIACLKNSYVSRSRQAAELAINIEQDCLKPLQDMITEQQSDLSRL